MGTCIRCSAPLVCTLCETCPEHCQVQDPVACALEAAVWAEQHLGADDPRTARAREQLEEARLNVRAKDAAERSRALVLRAGIKPAPRGKPN